MNSYIAVALVLCIAVAQVQSQAAVGKEPPAGVMDLMKMMKSRGGKGMPLGMRMGVPGKNSLFTPRPKLGGALPFIMKMRMLDAMGIENPLIMMNMMGGGMGGLGALVGMGSTPRGLGEMMGGMPGNLPMSIMGGANRGVGNNFMNRMLQMRMLASMDLV